MRSAADAAVGKARKGVSIKKTAGTGRKAPRRKVAGAEPLPAGGPLTVPSVEETPRPGVRIEIVDLEAAARGREPGAGTRIPYDVKHAFRGRVRIASRFLANHKDVLARLASYLAHRQGVSGVEANPRCGSITIRYDCTVTRQDRLLARIQALSVAELCRWEAPPPSEAGDRAGGGLQDSSANVVRREAVVRKASFLERNAHLHSSRIACKVQHAMRGRLRVKVPMLAAHEDLSESLQQRLSAEPGVTGIQANVRCGSFTIRHDLEVVEQERILRSLENITVRELIEIRSELPVRVREEHEVSKGYLKMASAGVGLSLLLGGAPAVALPVVYPLLIYMCVPIYKRAWRCMRHERRLNVDFLDACALTVGMLTGDVINASLMSWLIHLGDHIRDLTAASSQRTIRKLLDFQENYAWIVRDGVEVKVKVREIEVDDVVALNVGNLIPVDGEIVEGDIIVDQQVLTGESLPVHKEVGDGVLAATVIRDGKAYVRVTRTGEKTKVAQVVRMVEEAPLYETRIQNHAEKFADRLVAPSLLTTGLIFSATLSLPQLAALLTVDFGTGMRVSAPTAVLSSMIASASQGILIKGGSYLEKLCSVDTIVFDKTGTLTTGVIKVEDLLPFNGWDERELLSYAATAELQMTHPIAEAVVREAQERGVPLKRRGEAKYFVGRGVRAEIEGKQVLVGSLRLQREQSVPLDASVEERTDRIVAQGKACLYVSVDGRLAGIVSFRDQIRAESREMIDALHKVGVKQVIMLTGDVRKVAIPVAESLGIDRCIAEVLPEQKAEVIIDLKQEGRLVAFVGDGINDSVALSYADIGISVHGGADITKETAGVILLDDNLMKIPRAFQISKETIRLIKENYRIVGIFNVLAYGFAGLGLLSPVITTLISNGSAVVACVNGMKPTIRMKLDPNRLGLRGRPASRKRLRARPPAEEACGGRA